MDGSTCDLSITSCPLIEYEDGTTCDPNVASCPPAVPMPPSNTDQEQQAASDVSDQGLDFLTRHEGIVKKLYNDPANHCSIGIGHLVHKGPCNGSEPESFKDGLTDAEVKDLLRTDAAKAVGPVTRLVTVPLSQQQFDALVSFVFNVGEGNFKSSTLLKELNQGHYDKVPQELNRWVKAEGKTLPGLVSRRADEGNLFTNGVY